MWLCKSMARTCNAPVVWIRSTCKMASARTAGVVHAYVVIRWNAWNTPAMRMEDGSALTGLFRRLRAMCIETTHHAIAPEGQPAAACGLGVAIPIRQYVA